jgi:predicted amidohydrolase YtcJ
MRLIRLLLSGIVAFLCLAAACRDGPTGPRRLPDPDLILFNARVLTMDAELPVVQAVAIRGETIAAVGSTPDVLALRGTGTTVMDLGGRALLPGFVDAHNHVFHSVFFGWHPEIVGTSYAEAQERMLAVGMTTHGNPGGFPEFVADFLPFATSGALRVRASLYLQPVDFCGNRFPDGWFDHLAPLTDPRAMFRIPGVKIFTDGGACARVALSIPEGNPFGDLFMGSEELQGLVTAAHAAGFQVAIHALGDRALDTVFHAVAAVRAAGIPLRRPRIEHNRIVRPDQWARYGALDAVPVVFGQPFTCQIIDGGAWSSLQNDDHWVAVARPWFDPWRALLDANPGRPVAWHSDFRFFAFAPLTHLWSLVTRRDLREDGSVCEPPAWLRTNAVTVHEALRMMTIHAAAALMLEDHVGSIRAGKLADLIVLSADPLAVDPDEIRHLAVVMTVVGGEVLFRAPE